MSESDAAGVAAGFDDAFFAGAIVLDGAEGADEAAGAGAGFAAGAAIEPPDGAGDEAGAASEEAVADFDFLLFFEEVALLASAAGAFAFDALASAAGVEDASLDALSDFLLRVDFFVGEASAVAAAPPDASAPDFLLRLDFFVVEASDVADELSVAPASAFLLFFDDFFVVESSAGAVELSVEAASAFLDFFDFLVVVVVL